MDIEAFPPFASLPNKISSTKKAFTLSSIIRCISLAPNIGENPFEATHFIRVESKESIIFLVFNFSENSNPKRFFETRLRLHKS